jgi:hypothetical protein
MSPNEIAIAQSAANATWFGGVANSLVVCTTLFLATREIWIVRNLRIKAVSRARRKMRDGYAGLIGAATDALAFYPVDGECPSDLVRNEITQRSESAYGKISNIIVNNLSDKEQDIYEDNLGVCAFLNGSISAAESMPPLTASERRKFHARLDAWRAKISNALIALS